ncbi:MAG: hypothetical protein HUU50_00135 [Candidatus Brocadiae bacterium]|nr:hypothetical protein [Candidatus Brocadiia bacterium]
MATIDVMFDANMKISSDEIYSIDGICGCYGYEKAENKSKCMTSYKRHGSLEFQLVTIKRKLQNTTLAPKVLWEWFLKGSVADITLEVKDDITGGQRVIQQIILKSSAPIKWFIELNKEDKHILECLEVAPKEIEVKAS